LRRIHEKKSFYRSIYYQHLTELSRIRSPEYNLANQVEKLIETTYQCQRWDLLQDAKTGKILYERRSQEPFRRPVQQAIYRRCSFAKPSPEYQYKTTIGVAKSAIKKWQINWQSLHSIYGDPA